MNKNLRDSIFESGILEGNTDQLNEFKKEFRRAYKKQYNKKYTSSKTKKKALTFTPEEWEYLEEQSKKYNMRMATFLKSLIFAYLSSTFIHQDEESISNIEYLLRQIQNKLSGIAPHLFTTESGLMELQELKNQIRVLDDFVREALIPKRLDVFIDSNLSKDSMFLQKLLSAVAKHIS